MVQQEGIEEWLSRMVQQNGSAEGFSRMVQQEGSVGTPAAGEGIVLVLYQDTLNQINPPGYLAQQRQPPPPRATIGHSA